MKKTGITLLSCLLAVSALLAQSGRIVGLQFDNSNGTSAVLYPTFTDETSGVMTRLSQTPSSSDQFSSGNSTVDPVNYKYYYIRGLNGHQLITVDLTTGMATSSGVNNPNNANIPLTNIQYNPADGFIYGVNMVGSTLRFAKLDPSTSLVSLVNSNPISSDQFLSGNATIDPVSGTYYYVRGAQGNQLIRVDVQSGTSTSVSITNPNQALQPILNIQWNPQDSMLYGLNFTMGQLRLAKMDPATGVVTLVSSGPTSGDMFSSGVAALDVDAQSFVYVRGVPGAQQIVRVDVATGQVQNSSALSVNAGAKNLTNIEWLPVSDPVSRFDAPTGCGDYQVSFADLSLSDNVSWDFGDGNQSTSANPTHMYAAPGTYTVRQIANTSLGSDTSFQTISISPGIALNLGPDVSIFPGDTITLDATTTGAVNYYWNTLATTPSIEVTQGGTYSCVILDSTGCFGRDTVEVTSKVTLAIDDTSNTNVYATNAAGALEAVVWVEHFKPMSSTYFYELDVTTPEGWTMEEVCSNGMEKLAGNQIRMAANSEGGFHIVFNPNGISGVAEGMLTLIDESNTDVLRNSMFIVSNTTLSVGQVSDREFNLFPNPAQTGSTIRINEEPVPFELYGINGVLLQQGINNEIAAPLSSGVYFLKSQDSMQRVVVIE